MVNSKSFSEKILVVEDDLFILEYIVDLLKEEYEVVTATTGVEALIRLEENKFFCVLSDYKMPMMNGLELLKESKQRYPNLPFYLVSAFGDKEILLNSLKEGIDGYFDKPINSKELKKVLKEVRERRIAQIKEDEDLYQSFFNDTEQLLEDLEFKLSTLEQENDNTQDIKRILHTIKGSSSFLEKAKEIEELCHVAEDMIKIVLSTETLIPPPVVDLLIKSVEILKKIIEQQKIDLNYKYNIEEIKNEFKNIVDSKFISKSVLVSKEPAAAKNQKSEGIFIANERLDYLMDLVGNLVILRNSFYDSHDNSIANDSKETFAKNRDLIQQLDALSHSLHTEVMAVRKTPLSNVFKSYHRFVRELAKLTSKKINLIVDDHHVLVDKDAGRYLSEALIHIIRNAADHGLESSDTRLAQGKNETGAIKITAEDALGSTFVTVEDDGQGINPEKVFKKAIEKGIYKEGDEKRISETDKLNLIFHSSFSTADKVTHISGRGEGMDIVKNSLEKVKGKINVSSIIGKGTKFTIEIPHVKTINIIRSLIVKIDQQLFSVSTKSIKQIINVNLNQITSTPENKLISLDDGILHLVDLAKIVDFSKIKKNSPKEKRKNTNQLIAILEKDKKRLGLMIDEAVSQLQLVHREFEYQIFDTPIFGGTTILKDGTPCLVINADYLFDKARVA